MLAATAAEILLVGRGSRPDTDERSPIMSTADEHKTAVRICLENAAKGNFDALPEVVSPSFELHPAGISGIPGLVEMVEGYRSALADLRVTIEHQFTEGDYVATRSTLTGRHEGDLLGTPPTGREVLFSMLTISRCRDGKIEEEWEIADMVSLLAQVGALPDTASA
jgi:predicted ester cyclase